jgi:hypothetical protein
MLNGISVLTFASYPKVSLVETAALVRNARHGLERHGLLAADHALLRTAGNWLCVLFEAQARAGQEAMAG